MPRWWRSGSDKEFGIRFDDRVKLPCDRARRHEIRIHFRYTRGSVFPRHFGEPRISGSSCGTRSAEIPYNRNRWRSSRSRFRRFSPLWRGQQRSHADCDRDGKRRRCIREPCLVLRSPFNYRVSALILKFDRARRKLTAAARGFITARRWRARRRRDVG